MEWIEGVMVNDLEAGIIVITMATGLGGPGLNITNSRAGVLLNQNGVNLISISLENNFSDTMNILSENYPTEMLVHGPLCLNYRLLCCLWSSGRLYTCGHYCLQEYGLTDELNNQYRITATLIAVTIFIIL